MILAIDVVSIIEHSFRSHFQGPPEHGKDVKFVVLPLSYTQSAEFPMSIYFESPEVALRKLRERLQAMSDEGLIEFGKCVRSLCGRRVSGTGDRSKFGWKRRGRNGGGDIPKPELTQPTGAVVLLGTSTVHEVFGYRTSMIGPCQEAKSPPDALRRSAGVNSFLPLKRVVLASQPRFLFCVSEPGIGAARIREAGEVAAERPEVSGARECILRDLPLDRKIEAHRVPRLVSIEVAQCSADWCEPRYPALRSRRLWLWNDFGHFVQLFLLCRALLVLTCRQHVLNPAPYRCDADHSVAPPLALACFRYLRTHLVSLAN